MRSGDKDRILRELIVKRELDAINLCQRLLRVSFWSAKDIVRGMKND